MTTRGTDNLWDDIDRAGGVDAYIESQLRERGFLVERRDTEELSKKEKEAYKKSLKEEAREKRELKKKAWLAYKAAHIVHLGDGVFWNDAVDFDRFDAPDAEARIQDNELPVFEKPRDLAAALDLSLPELRTLTYHREVSRRLNYRCFYIPKRDGTRRAIREPLPRLKKAQSFILREIVEHLPVHGAAHGFLPGRSILTNAEAHVNSRLVLRIDIKDFFPTITFRRVKGLFRKAGYREQIATLLALLTTEAPRKTVRDGDQDVHVSLGPRSLPQGAPTSPAITNAICLRLDRRLSGLAAKFGWRYTRYADDLTFSLPKTTKSTAGTGRLMGIVGRILRSEGFQVHRKKTWLARSGARQQVTGLVVNGDGTPRIPRRLKRNLRAALHNARKGKGFQTEEGEDQARHLRRLLGYAAYVYMVEPDKGRELFEGFRDLKPSGGPSEDPPAPGQDSDA